MSYNDDDVLVPPVVVEEEEVLEETVADDLIDAILDVVDDEDELPDEFKLADDFDQNY